MTPPPTYIECLVVGAGVIGLAVARALALHGREVVVIESTDAIGSETSSRNSEVIHAGIYYSHESYMARFCREGRQALYSYCEKRGVLAYRCGKLIVATSDEEAQQLPKIRERAALNGVELHLLTASEVVSLEPQIQTHGALFSTETGILDSHAFMLSLRQDAETAGAVIAFKSPLIRATISQGGPAGRRILVQVGGYEPVEAHCGCLINAAGLSATALAHNFSGMPSDLVPTTYFAKGNYFSLLGSAPASRLVYPLPVVGGLGIHLTFDRTGQVRFGPDVEWIDRLDYAVDPRRAVGFYEAIRRYWPDLLDDALQPAYSGIRPKITPPGGPAQDFFIHGPSKHGVPGLVNLFGIESPGLTASLAIADYVAEEALWSI